MIKNNILALVCCLVAMNVRAASVPDNLLNAIRLTETGGSKNGGVWAKGRHGEIGPYQITPRYFKDVVNKSGVRSFYNCQSEIESRKVVEAYFNRYGAEYLKSGDLKSLAILHHCGPNATSQKKAKFGESYWEKVKSNLK